MFVNAFLGSLLLLCHLLFRLASPAASACFVRTTGFLSTVCACCVLWPGDSNLASTSPNGLHGQATSIEMRCRTAMAMLCAVSFDLQAVCAWSIAPVGVDSDY